MAVFSLVSMVVSVIVRHVRGSRKRIPGSDPKDLDPGSVRIINPTLTVCRQIHWDHRSVFAIRRDIHSDPRSKIRIVSGSTGIRDPRKETHVSLCSFLFFKEINNIFSLKYKHSMHCHIILSIFYPEIA